MTIPYATLAQAQTELSAQNTAATTEALNYLQQALFFVSDRINKEFPIGDVPGLYMEFAPRVDTRYYDAYGIHINDFERLLFLDYPLLSPTMVTISNNELTLNTQYVPEPRNNTPIASLRRKAASFGWAAGWGVPSIEWQDAIQVTGVWGFRTRYAMEGWLASLDSIQNVGGINASATSITVTDADGANGNGITPRFSPGALLLIETEYLLVTAVNTTSNVLTVRRGMNGSTAASHAQSTAINLWQAEDAIVRATLRWVDLLYARRGAFDKTTFDGMSTTEFPEDMPGDVSAILRSIPLWTPVGAA